MARVTVMRDKYVKGWPRHEHGDRAWPMDLSRALKLGYSTDAHFTAYQSPNDRRLVREAIEQLDGIEMTAAVFDVDCPETHGTPEPAPEVWRLALRAKMRGLAEAHAGGYCYETKGGARIVYTLGEPFILRSQNDAAEWSQRYAVAVAYLARRFEIVADPACNDWQRMYRLPHATRAPGGEPEDWPTLGDVDAIGALKIEASSADVVVADGATNAFRKCRSRPLAAHGDGGDGLFYWLLRGRGDVGAAAARGGWVALCPNRRRHTTKTDGSDSTVVYPPGPDEQLGLICCKHAHCVGLRAKDWLGLFSDNELEAGRRAAGISRVA